MDSRAPGVFCTGLGRLIGEYLEYLIEDWEFSSEQAIALEYMEEHEEGVSTL